jgi:hypothetical protein
LVKENWNLVDKWNFFIVECAISFYILCWGVGSHRSSKELQNHFKFLIELSTFLLLLENSFLCFFFFLVDICEASGYGQSKDFSNFQAFDPLVLLP